LSLRTRETVVQETPASRAISMKVTLLGAFLLIGICFPRECKRSQWNGGYEELREVSWPASLHISRGSGVRGVKCERLHNDFTSNLGVCQAFRVSVCMLRERRLGRRIEDRLFATTLVFECLRSLGSGSCCPVISCHSQD
jgi:hypothetical protein